ncbi:unnamed protein product [Rhizoctonia solani]|uniref:Uncharacterized protein n=1 Tax=Rhizoctonia solani TaxID=456999 RepID=A0A8H3A775_9AGAM|nr:unnamed protein product [Rhizoctonia solani]
MDKDLSDKQPFHGNIPPTLQRALDSTSNTSVWSTHQSSLNDLGVPQASHDHPNGDANKTPVAYPPPPQPSEAAELPHNRCIGILPLLPQGVGVDANLLRNSNQARLPPHSRSTGAPPAQSTSVPISLPTNTFGSASRPLDRLRAPKVKVCLLSAGRGLPALKDASLIMGELDGIRGIDHENVISRTSKAIDIALDRFFELDIHEGGIFILIISGHGCLAGDRMNLEFKTGNGIIVSSEVCTSESLVAIVIADQGLVDAGREN